MTAAPSCPRDGAEMNRHADRLVLAQSQEEIELIDVELGGWLKEVFTRPVCGHYDSRPESALRPIDTSRTARLT